MMYAGLALLGGGLFWYLRNQQHDQTPTQAAVKVGDRVMAKVAGMNPPLLRAVPPSGGSPLSPPEMIPARVYGIQGPNVYARVDTSDLKAFAHNWDGTDVSFLLTDVDGILDGK